MASRAAQKAYLAPQATFNLAVNGGMDVWQNGTSIAIGVSTQSYTADQWSVTAGGSNAHSVTQSTDVPTPGNSTDAFRYSLKFQRDSGQTGTAANLLEQPFETERIAQLRGQQITVSFYAKAGANYSPSGSAFQLYFMTGTGTESRRGGGAHTGEVIQINNQTVTLTTSWQRFEYTTSTAIPSNATEASLQFYTNPTGTAGADDSFYLTGVQIEPGGKATQFKRQPYIETVGECKRFFTRAYRGTSNATIPGMIGFCRGTTDSRWIFPLTVPLRAQPTLTITNAQINDGVGNYGVTSYAVDGSYNTDDCNYSFYAFTSSGMTIGRGCNLYVTGAAEGYVELDARL